ncbi:MAG: lipid-transfer protein [Sphingobium sp.]
MSALRDRTAIAGIGATEFSKNSGRTEMTLAAQAVMAALHDAGLTPADVDGMVTLDIDNNSVGELQRAIGGEALSWFCNIPGGGGGGAGAVALAMQAVATGVAKVVVCYRAMNERSEYRYGQPMSMTVPTAQNAVFAYQAIHGMQTAAAMMAMCMRRYMHETGASPEDFGTVTVMQRGYAATNPAAFFYGKPITMDDYLSARMIAEPLRLLDCCQESDGAVALVVTAADHARSLRQPPVLIRGAAQALPNLTMYLNNFYRDDIVPWQETAMVARQLYAMSDLSPDDIDAAIIYDHFIPSVLPSLEAFGFCERGEAKDFIKGGTLALDGRLPLNMNGGQIGEAYIHGFNGIAEAVRQVRGTAVNQVAKVENIIATSGSGVPTSGLILGRA